jgi:hypothetical protein
VALFNYLCFPVSLCVITALEIFYNLKGLGHGINFKYFDKNV